jgi:hypothetical protein
MAVAADGTTISDDTFAAGLVPRREALAARREKMTQQSPFDDGLPDEEGPDEAPVSPETEEETPPAAAAPPSPRQTRRRGPGKKRRGRETANNVDVAIDPMGQTAVAGAPAEEEDLLEMVSLTEGGINPKDPLLYWPRIIATARAKGFGPEYLQIRIERQGTGAHPTPFIPVDTIEGEMVAGDGTNAGQELVDYLTNVVHIARRTPGPATYKLQAFYKVRSSGGFPVMVIKLDHPDEIRAQQMRRDEYFRRKETLSGPTGLPGLGRPPVPRAAGYPTAPPPTAPPPMFYPQATVPPQGQGLADTLAQLRAYEEWRQQTIAAGQPAPPPAPQIVHMPAPVAPPSPSPAPMPPALTAEQEQLIFEAKMHRFIETQGYVKPGVGAPAKPAEIKSQASGFKDIIQAFKELETFKLQIREAVGAGVNSEGEEEEPEPKELEDKISVVQIPGATIGGRPIMLPRKTKGTIDFFQQAVMSNLETSQELAVKAIGGIAQTLDKTSFGKLLESLAAKGGQPAQLAAAAKASGLTGTGAVNGTAVLQRPRGPMA